MVIVRLIININKLLYIWMSLPDLPGWETHCGANQWAAELGWEQAEHQSRMVITWPPPQNEDKNKNKKTSPCRCTLHRDISPSKLVAKESAGDSLLGIHSISGSRRREGRTMDPHVVAWKLCMRGEKASGGNTYTSNVKAHPLKNYPREYAALWLPAPKTKKGQPS